MTPAPVAGQLLRCSDGTSWRLRCWSAGRAARVVQLRFHARVPAAQGNRLRRALLGAIAASALLAAGCGGPSAATQVRNTTQQFLTALEHRDAKKACSLLTPAGQQRMFNFPSAGARCEQQAAAVLPSASQLLAGVSLSVASVQVNGNSATASVARGAAGQGHALASLVRQGGSWKLDQFMAVP